MFVTRRRGYQVLELCRSSTKEFVALTWPGLGPRLGPGLGPGLAWRPRLGPGLGPRTKARTRMGQD